jgi:hypothetical protein
MRRLLSRMSERIGVKTGRGIQIVKDRRLIIIIIIISRCGVELELLCILRFPIVISKRPELFKVFVTLV